MDASWSSWSSPPTEPQVTRHTSTISKANKNCCFEPRFVSRVGSFALPCFVRWLAARYPAATVEVDRARMLQFSRRRRMTSRPCYVDSGLRDCIC